MLFNVEYFRVMLKNISFFPHISQYPVQFHFFCLHSNSADKHPPICHDLNSCKAVKLSMNNGGKLFFFHLGNALLDDDKVFHLVRPADELDDIKSKRGSIKDKSMTKAITEIYLTRLLSVKVGKIRFIYSIIYLLIELLSNNSFTLSSPV